MMALLASCPANAASPPSPRDEPYPGTITLEVDTTDVRRGIFRVNEHVPVNVSGEFTLIFPRWVPGNHAPTAPINRLAGLQIRSGKRLIPWRRDEVRPNLFRVSVPTHTKGLDIEFQYLSPLDGAQERVVATADMLNLEWYAAVLYPAGYYARQIRVRPSITLPAGWSFATQLDGTQHGSDVNFAPVDVEYLVDSPVFAGRYFRRFKLTTRNGAVAFLNVFGDRPEYVDAREEGLVAHRYLVEQAEKLFGPLPTKRYDFLLALTRELGGVGTEHLASSENTSSPAYFTDWQNSFNYRGLLPHELSHAWNGKARRPADLWSPDFNQPMRNSLLWVYEGQSALWGWVLAARSGLMTREEALDGLARFIAPSYNRPGRRWRSLQDTVNDPLIDYEGTNPWPSWARSTDDFYAEGALLWLEIDGLLRELSHERHSLDDFAGRFFRFPGGAKLPSLYTFNDVVRTLNSVQSYPWARMLRGQLDAVGGKRPEWLSRSGYRLVFEPQPTPYFLAAERRAKLIDLRYSIGFSVSVSDPGQIHEVIWGSPAFDAELAPGAVINQVEGHPFESDALLAAIAANVSGGRPLHLTVKQGGRERSLVIDYRGGLRYPRLQRLLGQRDRLGSLLAPR